MSDPFIGQIQMFGFSFAPRNWAFCHGGMMSINDNQPLFALINTIYGGDGRSSFGLPDLRGRMPLGEGQGPGLVPHQIGQRGGFNYGRLTIANLPSHNHAAQFTAGGSGEAVEVYATTEEADSNTPSQGAYLSQTVAPEGGPDKPENIYKSNPDTSKLVSLGGVNGGSGAGGTVTVGNTGGGDEFSIMNPHLAINFCIALQGLFPSRN